MVVVVEEAAGAATLHGRGTTGKGTAGARAARRTEDENMLFMNTPSGSSILRPLDAGGGRERGGLFLL